MKFIYMLDYQVRYNKNFLHISQTREKQLLRTVISWVDRLDEIRKQFSKEMSTETVSLLYKFLCGL